MDEKVSRRFLLQQSPALCALVVLATAACNKKAALSCADTSSLPPTDVQVRTALGYVDSSVEPGKMCSGCAQFIAPPGPGVCGSCKVVKGPINPSGYCKSFVAKAT